MTARHVVLAVLGAAVLVAGVYLFHEVRSTPAAEGATEARVARSPDREPVAEATANRGGDHDPKRPAVKGGVTESVAPPVIASDDDGEGSERANPSIDAVMDRANKAYDRSDFEEAKMIAGKVLSKLPTNIRMMRIMVSASCIDGDVVVAQKWYEQLPKTDRDQMKTRCDKYGVAFKEPPQ